MVNSLPIRSLLAGAVLWMAGMRLCATPLPFTIDTQDGQWKPASVRQVVAPGISFEMVATHIGGADRLIVLSSPNAGVPPDSLSAFAHRLIDSFTSYRSANVTEKAAAEMDYHGRELQFDLAGEKDSFDCKLFVFADGPTEWGILYVRPKNAPATPTPVFSLLHKTAALPSGVVTLEPFRVKDVPLSDFPISFEVTRNAGGDRVMRIAVTNVPQGSATEQAGVKAGDAIVAINGRKAQDFAVGVGKNSELGRIFLNRTPGDEVELEIMPADSSKSYSVTLRAHSLQDNNNLWRGLR